MNSPLIWQHRNLKDWLYIDWQKQVVASELKRAKQGIRLNKRNSSIDLENIVILQSILE